MRNSKSKEYLLRLIKKLIGYKEIELKKFTTNSFTSPDYSNLTFGERENMQKAVKESLKNALVNQILKEEKYFDIVYEEIPFSNKFKLVASISVQVVNEEDAG